MKSVIFLVGPALGHVGRSLTIARSLRKKSHQLRIEFIALGSQYSEGLLLPEFPCRIVPRGQSTLSDIAVRLEAALSEARPDALVLDLSPLPWLAVARLPSVPTVFVTNYFLTPLFHTDTYQTSIWEARKQEWSILRESRGLAGIDDPKALYLRDMVLLADPPELLPAGLELPESYRLVGPCSWEPQGVVPEELTRYQRSLVGSFGSTGSNPVDGQRLDSLVRSLDLDCCIWLGSLQSIEGRCNTAVQAQDVPLSTLLKTASLAITQGGAGSTYLALASRVPVLVQPGHRNHEIMADELCRAGVGMHWGQFCDESERAQRKHLVDMSSKLKSWRAETTHQEGGVAAELLAGLV